MTGFSQQARAWFILSAMMILILLINIDYTAVNIAMVAISHEIKVELNTLQWLLSGYVLAWAACVIPAGQLADIYGKRFTLLIGISIFMVASIMCGFVNTAPLLIIARVLQGFGGALFVPPLYALVFDCFPENKRGFAIGMLGVGAGIGLAIGPSFGGFILETLGWRWIFLLNGPLCLITLMILWLFAQKEEAVNANAKMDIGGSFLLGSALAITIFALNQTEIWGFTDARFLGLIATALGLIAVFIKTSRHKKDPLIPRGLFSNIPFLGTLIGFSIYSFGFSVVLVTLGLFLQNVQGYDAYTAGIIFLAMTISIGILSPFGGQMSDKMDPRIPICSGLALLSMALVMAGFLTVSSSLMFVLGVLLLIGLGMGLSFPALNATMMKTVDSSILSTASGTFIMGCCSANTLGVVVASNMLVGVGRLYLGKVAEMSEIGIDGTTYEALTMLLSSAHRDLSLLNHHTAENTQVFLGYINDSFTNSLSWIMWMTAALMFVAFVAGYKMILVKKTDGSQSSQPVIF